MTAQAVEDRPLASFAVHVTRLCQVGNLHQWTDEYTDAHTRSAVTKGGSNYHPIAPPSGMWYFPQVSGQYSAQCLACDMTRYRIGLQPHKVYEHNKFLLLSPSMDRSGGIGEEYWITHCHEWR